MHKEIIQVLFLAALSDGELHEEEKVIISQYTKSYPVLKNISSEEIKNELKYLSNKIQSGIDIKYILRGIKDNLNKDQLSIAYALGVELCCVNFELVPPENDFIKSMEKIFKIDNEIINQVKGSAMLRYSTKL